MLERRIELSKENGVTVHNQNHLGLRASAPDLLVCTQARIGPGSASAS